MDGFDWSKFSPALGAAAVVTAFAAVGVAGDLLPRLVRNQPLWAAILVSVAILAVFALLINKDPVRIVAGTVLALTLVGTTILGVASLADRENPSVALIWQPEDNNQIRLEVSAAATSLRNRENMLVQVLGFPEPLGPVRLEEECITSRRQDDIEKDDLAVLLWEESGPNQKGQAEVMSSIYVAQGMYAAVCAAVISRDRNPDTLGDDRYTWAYVPLR